MTGLYSMRARMYAPSAGRFLSRDVWPYDFQNPLELNRYVYAANNAGRCRDVASVFGVTSSYGAASANSNVCTISSFVLALLGGQCTTGQCTLNMGGFAHAYAGGGYRAGVATVQVNAGAIPLGGAIPQTLTWYLNFSSGQGTSNQGGHGDNSNDEIPTGFTQEEWARFKEDARQFLENSGLAELGGELEVQGSRVPSKGKPVGPETDLDMILRVSPDIFDELANDYFRTVSNPPNEQVRLINQQKMTYFVLGSRNWGRFTAGDFYAMFYDNWLNNYRGITERFNFSVVVSGSTFDTGPFIRIYP